MKHVDFSRVLQYYINLNNSTATPVLLAGVDILDVTIPSQLQSALTYLLLASTYENCRNVQTVNHLVHRIQVGMDCWVINYSITLSIYMYIINQYHIQSFLDKSSKCSCNNQSCSPPSSIDYSYEWMILNYLGQCVLLFCQPFFPAIPLERSRWKQ